MAKIIKKQGEERDQYTAVLESLRSDFKVFGEALGVVRDDVSGLKKDMVGVKQILDSHTKTLDSQGKTLSSHTQILNSHTEMLGQLMVDMTEVKNGLKTKVNCDDFAKLEQRVVRLEAKVR